MTNHYVQLIDCDEAKRYIASVLRHGNTLGTLAADSLAVVGGIYALTPAQTTAPDLPPLTQGGLRSQVDSLGAIGSEVEKYLSTGTPRAVVFEDAMAQANDEWLSGPSASNLRVAVCDSEVHYVLLPEDIGTDRVAQTIAVACSESYHMVGVFSELKAVGRTLRIRLFPEDIREIVVRAKSIVMGAFDGESFLRFGVRAPQLNPDRL